MVMYSHQFGPRSGGLTVLVSNSKMYPVWERAGAVGDIWVKNEVEIVSNSTFQVSTSFLIRLLNLVNEVLRQRNASSRTF